MFRSAKIGRNLLLALILSVFLLPFANAGLVEVYINNSDELTESENFSEKENDEVNLNEKENDENSNSKNNNDSDEKLDK